MHDLSPADIAQLAAVGISPEAAAAQLVQLRNSPPPIRLIRTATVGDGILLLPASESDGSAALIADGRAASDAGRVLKFVPASGAATRMFQDLCAAFQSSDPLTNTPAVQEFFLRFDDLPFAAELRQRAGLSGAPATEQDQRLLLHTMLVEMAMAGMPKALVPFHRGARVRTAFEEQLREAAHYTRDSNGVSRLHFTVPADSQRAFAALLDELRPILESPRDRFAVEFSVQSPSTDTLALDDRNAPFRAANGTLLLRPSGHGALLGNLQACGGDIVVVKNIDNILPDEQHKEVVHWKRLMIGYLARLQAEVFAHLSAITGSSPSPASLDAARLYAATRLARSLDADASRDQIVAALDRPLRVCGVVRNVGEPGGAPFWVRDADGSESLQIVEPAQVNFEDLEQAEIFLSATHFNPVDLICGLRDHTGKPYDLSRFVDPATAFVTEKTADGRTLTALERPGLWNGSMAGWNTVCVEVPASTFAPVKTVLDLLRPQHQVSRVDASAPATGR
jgi:hypothetical protein